MSDSVPVRIGQSHRNVYPASKFKNCHCHQEHRSSLPILSSSHSWPTTPSTNQKRSSPHEMCNDSTALKIRTIELSPKILSSKSSPYHNQSPQPYRDKPLKTQLVIITIHSYTNPQRHLPPRVSALNTPTPSIPPTRLPSPPPTRLTPTPLPYSTLLKFVQTLQTPTHGTHDLFKDHPCLYLFSLNSDLGFGNVCRIENRRRDGYGGTDTDDIVRGGRSGRGLFSVVAPPCESRWGLRGRVFGVLDEGMR